jgi:hypothetical protein
MAHATMPFLCPRVHGGTELARRRSLEGRSHVLPQRFEVHHVRRQHQGDGGMACRGLIVPLMRACQDLLRLFTRLCCCGEELISAHTKRRLDLQQPPRSKRLD